MTLAQQIQTLQGRGLMIADTNKAEQALDAISYFRLADYWYHLQGRVAICPTLLYCLLAECYRRQQHFRWRPQAIAASQFVNRFSHDGIPVKLATGTPLAVIEYTE